MKSVTNGLLVIGVLALGTGCSVSDAVDNAVDETFEALDESSDVFADGVQSVENNLEGNPAPVSSDQAVATYATIPGSQPNMPELIGIYDYDSNEGLSTDQKYLQISSLYQWIVWDYQDDDVNRGQNCYVRYDYTLALLEDDIYRIQGNGSTSVLRIERFGNVLRLSVPDGLASSSESYTGRQGISATDFNLCT